MSLRSLFRAWWRSRADQDPDGESALLREFVYLDDVSVYSLRASQVGPIVTELSDTQATSLQSDVSASAGASVGVVKGELSSGIQAGQTQSSQVLRKAIIQTTFKKMYETASHALAFAPPDANVPTPKANTLEDLLQIADDNSQSMLVSGDRIKRGDLVELEVQLETEPIFRAGTIFAAIHEIIKDDPALFGVDDVGQLNEVRVAVRMLEKLMAGLVPVRGRLVDYRMAELNGTELLVHQRLAQQLPAEHLSPLVPVVVGVADRSLFWKDVRRVLFSGSSYRVLGRVARDGFQPSWTPVKLVNVMREVMPEFADIIDGLNRGVLSAMGSATTNRPTSGERQRIRRTLEAYAALIAERTGVVLDAGSAITRALEDLPSPVDQLSIPEWREVFAPITAMIVEETGTAIDPAIASECRVAALSTVGLLSDDTKTQPASLPESNTQERFLDLELVAIYW